MIRQIVEAGAGCGKTYSLVSRYINALGFDPETGKRHSDTPIHPKDIYCLTFTDLAAKEMLERILLRLKDLKLDSQHQEVLNYSQISTFHSFCYRILAPQLPQLGYKSSQIESENWVANKRENWIREFLYKHPLRKQILSDASLAQIIDWTREAWFENSEFKESKIISFFRTSNEALEQSYFKLKNTINDFAKSNPKLIAEKPQSWPALLYRYLNGEENLIFEINFKSDTKPALKKEKPDIYDLARAYVKFVKEGISELLKPNHNSKELNFLKLLHNFITECSSSAEKYLDFSALEHEMLNLVLNKESPFHSNWKAPKLFIVDEFQDTNHSQLKILEALSGAQTDWYLVGDPKQSIYSFRAARIEIFTTLTKTLEHLQLSKNYRSSPELLEFLNQFQSKLFTHPTNDPPPQNLEAAKESFYSEKPVRLWVSEDKANEHWEALLESFNRRKSDNAASTHGFLFLKWKDLYNFAQYLDERSVNFQILGKESYLDHHLSHLFCFFLELIDDDHYKMARDSLDQWDFNFSCLPQKEERLTELFLFFIKGLAPHRWLKGSEWTGAMERLLYSLEEENISFTLSLSDLAQFLRKLTQKFATESATQSNSTSTTNTPLLLTIHASKGLEFDHIYLDKLYARRGNEVSNDSEDFSVDIKFFDSKTRKDITSFVFLHKKRQQYVLKESEMKRVFYVALTRAKKSLDIFYNQSTLKAPDIDPLEKLLGWPEKNYESWPQILQKLETLEMVEKIALPDSNQLSEEQPLWQLPMPKNNIPTSTAYFWGGVSEFLKQDNSANIKQETFPTKQKQNEFGNKLHSILEIWNAKDDSIDLILDKKDKDYLALRSAVESISRISELRDFFYSLSQNDHKVFRELPLMIHTDNACLSGVADAVYLKDDQEWWIIDWKTSSSLNVLKKEERVLKIEKQLSLYASCFKAFNKKLRGIAIAITPSSQDKQKASILIDKYF